MPVARQKKGNAIMKDRVKRYNVERWAHEFLQNLEDVIASRPAHSAISVDNGVKESLSTAFRASKSRTLFLDYDGTLAAFKNRPEDAIPTQELYDLLSELNANPKNELVLITGRDKETFETWFGHTPYALITEHGLWQRDKGEKEWKQLENVNNRWFEFIYPILERFTDRTPGSQIEIKNFSMAWHYRRVDPVLGEQKASEIKATIQPMIANHNIEIMEGDKVLEVKVSGVNKGKASSSYISESPTEFILAMGDDWTDEFMFRDLPKETVTMKVGNKKTIAKYRIKNTQSVYDFLRALL